ncbi:hypothetical protein GQ55_6G131400 [Panicum hallii var. hallii]|uniref:Uncharacterized protein n=1 Tax=Panicum hallii var. hallii TaxID=1504633 RepID=A0A2T7D663_9POAL|nr:hypothetical protein GQ55_6G131400 [Panicum hallii var. hallii]
MGGAGGKGTEHHVRALMEKLNLTAEEEEMAAFSDEEDDGGGVGRTGTDRKGSFAGCWRSLTYGNNFTSLWNIIVAFYSKLFQGIIFFIGSS